MKFCKPCGSMKPLSEFSRAGGRGDGHYAYCKTCSATKTRKWREANPMRYAEWALANRERGLDRHRMRRTDPTYRLREALRIHGLSIEDFDALVASQNNKCAICGAPPPESQRLHVDHDHSTGRVRGLLCGHCNKALGLFRDDPEVILRAVHYLGIIQFAEALGL